MRTLALLLALALAAPAFAAETTATEQVAASKLAALKARAEDWWKLRNTLVEVCPACKGEGKVKSGKVLVNCPKCGTRRFVVEPAAFRKVFFDGRSPAFRKLEKAKELVEAEYVAFARIALKAEPAKTVAGAELVDEEHGLAWTTAKGEVLSRAQAWTWVGDVKSGKGQWWLFDARADVAWPGEIPATARVVPLTGPALADGDAAAFRDAIAKANLHVTLKSAAAHGKTLLLALEAAPDYPGGRDLDEDLVPAFRETGKAAFAGDQWDDVQWVVSMWMQNAEGSVELRPFASYRIDEAGFAKVAWAGGEVLQRSFGGGPLPADGSHVVAGPERKRKGP